MQQFKLFFVSPPDRGETKKEKDKNTDGGCETKMKP